MAARRWVEAGAEWLHVVDLDGALAGQPASQETIARIQDAVDVPIQLGGGLRRLSDIEGAFAAGVARVILGTVALRQPELVGEAVTRWGDHVAVALDTRDGRLAAAGWVEQSDALAVDVARQLAAAGVRHFVLTDIRRDGGLSGPNMEGLREMIAAVDAGVIASGGISSLADVRATAAAGASGAIVGRALYDRRIDLTAAIAAARPREAHS